MLKSLLSLINFLAKCSSLWIMLKFTESRSHWGWRRPPRSWVQVVPDPHLITSPEQWMFSHSLETSRDGDPTTSLSIPFQCLTSLSMQKFLLMKKFLLISSSCNLFSHCQMELGCVTWILFLSSLHLSFYLSNKIKRINKLKIFNKIFRLFFTLASLITFA